MDTTGNIGFLIVVAERRLREELLALLTDCGGRIISSVYARGSAKAAGILQSAFSFMPEEHKIMVTCLVAAEAADQIIETLDTQLGFDRPNTGIAFTIPVTGLSY